MLGIRRAGRRHVVCDCDNNLGQGDWLSAARRYNLEPLTSVVLTLVPGTSHFRGVPFAASTAGANRWKPPQPREPWEGELDCTSYGDAPFQPPDTGMNGMLGGAKYDGQDIGRMGDDCLNLNIVTPGTSGRLPVMVWIHGVRPPHHSLQPRLHC